MNNDLISRSEAEKLGATCLAKRNENGQLEAIISLDNAPTVEITEKQAILHLINSGWLVNHDKELREKWKRPQGEWAEIEGGYICSNCEDIEAYTPNFCPNCGADMRKGGATNER